MIAEIDLDWAAGFKAAKTIREERRKGLLKEIVLGGRIWLIALIVPIPWTLGPVRHRISAVPHSVCSLLPMHPHILQTPGHEFISSDLREIKVNGTRDLKGYNVWTSV